MSAHAAVTSREILLHQLYEAAELEHNLMCTYLYAAFSMKQGEADGLSAREAGAVARWRRAIIEVATEEMGHLCAVWNITSALGGAPRFGRGNFPLDPGALPAGVIVKLAAFGEPVLQHFIHLERPKGSGEVDGAGFAPEFAFRRGAARARLTPMGIDYDTVGDFYETLAAKLSDLVSQVGEDAAFCGDPALQLSAAEIALPGAKPVICAKTALHAFKAIVEQGEGAPENSVGSHYRKFIGVRTEFRELEAANPEFRPAFPAAENPVQRPPMRASGRVWIEDPTSAATVDVANTAYGLMLRLIAYTYSVPRPQPEKALAIDLSLGLMHVVTALAERAARLPAGPSNPGCNAGVSFIALRDAASFPYGSAAHRFFTERLRETAEAAADLALSQDPRAVKAARQLAALAERAAAGFDSKRGSTTAMPAGAKSVAAATTAAAAASPPVPVVVNGVDEIDAAALTLLYEGKRCIHARFCVTGAPTVFLANVPGPWIQPDAIGVDKLVEIAHACPSGAIRYRRKDGIADESAPAVNLIAVREAGPYAVRGDIRLNGRPAGYRATLCRCGASKNKPFCDGSHHDAPFTASGEPPTGEATAMLAARDGPLAIDPQPDGPLAVRGNLEITSGTGRVVARIQSTRLCRCGGSATKPFCDGSHARNGFKAD